MDTLFTLQTFLILLKKIFVVNHKKIVVKHQVKVRWRGLKVARATWSGTWQIMLKIILFFKLV